MPRLHGDPAAADRVYLRAGVLEEVQFHWWQRPPLLPVQWTAGSRWSGGRPDRRGLVDPAGQRASGRETAAGLALAAAAVAAGIPLAGSSGEFGGRMGDIPYLGIFDRGRAREARSVLSTADREALGRALNKSFPPRTGVGVGFRPSWVGPGRILEVTNDTPAWAGPVVVSVNGLRPRWAAGDVAPGGTVEVGWRRTGVALRPGDRVVVRVGSVTAAEAVVP